MFYAKMLRETETKETIKALLSHFIIGGMLILVGVDHLDLLTKSKGGGDLLLKNGTI